MVSRGNGLERCGKGIECHPIAAVADRVGTHLKTATKAELGHLLEVSGLSQKQSGVSRIVRVFGEEGGAPRAQRTVGVRLDCADPDAAAVKSASRTALRIVGDVAGVVGDHYVVAEIELSLSRKILEYLNRAPRSSGVVDAREPPAVRFRDCSEGTLSQGCIGGRWNVPVDEAGSVVDEHSGGISVRKPNDFSTFRVFRGCGDSSEPHCHRIGEGRMTVDSAEYYRVVRCGTREGFMRREAFVRPESLVPPPSLDPFPRLRGAHALRNPPDHFVVAGRADKANIAKRGGKTKQVRVGVHHAGNHGAAPEVHEPRSASGKQARL